MLDLTVDSIEQMIGEQVSRVGTPDGFPALPELPAARYFDGDYAALQMERLWMKSWLVAGHVSELREPGAYKLFERVGRSVILSRGNDGQIHAFNNTCRHRGSAVVQEPRGKAARFVCPYHGWTYGPDGQLIAVTDPSQFPCLDKSAKGLVPVRCDIWRGLIFINFDADAEPLMDFLAPMARQAEAFPLEQFVVKGPHVYPLDCNWNIGIDNTLEVYHVRTLHPTTIAPYLEDSTFTVGLLQNGHSRFVARKKSGTILTPEHKAENVAGEMFGEYNICLSVFPNSFLLLDPASLILHSYWPDGPSRCIVEFTQFGLDSQDEAYFQQMHTVMEPVLDEDWRLFGPLQRSLETGVSTTIPLGYQERAIYWLQEEIDRRIGAEHIPERLRVCQMLAPFSEGREDTPPR